MSEKTYNHFAGQKVGRIEAISDGVFAVAMTLLVLDIKIPALELIHSEGDLAYAFLALAPKLLTYFMSFMTLGIFWTGHSSQYNYIEKSDRHLTWLSLFFLMCVSVLPFTTAFLSEFIEYKFAIAVYWANILILGVLIFVHWDYAYKHGFLNINGEQKEALNKAIRGRIITAQSLYAVAAALCFISTYLSIACTLAIQLNYAFAPFSRLSKK